MLPRIPGKVRGARPTGKLNGSSHRLKLHCTVARLDDIPLAPVAPPDLVRPRTADPDPWPPGALLAFRFVFAYLFAGFVLLPAATLPGVRVAFQGLVDWVVAHADPGLLERAIAGSGDDP